MNLDDIPTLMRFSRLYWNQMGPDIYGSVENALKQMLEDGGKSVWHCLHNELSLLANEQNYSDWFSRVRYNKATIRALGGAFILPEDIPRLLVLLDTWRRNSEKK